MEHRLIDTRTITSHGPDIHFTATPAEREQIAKRFDIPELLSLTVDGRFSYQDHITFDGLMTTRAKRTCVSTLNLFTEEASYPIHLLFSETETDATDDPEDVDILPVHKGKINLLDVFSEEFGLTLNPFPKSVNTYCDYHEANTDNVKNNPFSVLKKLKK